MKNPVLIRVEKPIGVEWENPFSPEEWPPGARIEFMNATDRFVTISILSDGKLDMEFTLQKACRSKGKLAPSYFSVYCERFHDDFDDHAKVKFRASHPGASVAIYLTFYK